MPGALVGPGQTLAQNRAAPDGPALSTAGDFKCRNPYLIAALESTIIRIPTSAGGRERLGIPVIEASMAAIVTDAMVNNVGLSTLTDAGADGAEAMVVQCDRTTSSPICQRIGMKKICDLDICMFETPDARHRGQPSKQ